MKLVDKIKYMMNKLNIKNISQLSKIAHIPYTTIKDIFNKDTLDIKLSTSKKLCMIIQIYLILT